MSTAREITAIFHPRIPRYDLYVDKQHRTGITGSLQWQPEESTLFTVDALYADFAQVRNEYQLEANSFSTTGFGAATSYTDPTTTPGTARWVASQGMQSIHLLSYTLGGPTGLNASHVATNTMQKATASNVGLRSEHRLDHLDTRFMQMTIDGKHDFSENFKVHVLVNPASSR